MAKATITGPCKLCAADAVLRESHVIPKFALAWLKEQGTGYIRNVTTPNLRLQDGKKQHLLCEACEQRFGAREMWFKANIFDPYLSGKQVLPYDDRLFYFAVSVLWRVLVTTAPDRTEIAKFRTEMTEVELEWRSFLTGGSLPARYNDVHLFLTDIGTRDGNQPIANWSRYFATSVDATIAGGDICIAYAKFARYMFIGAIKPTPMADMVGTKIDPVCGTLSTPQKFSNGIAARFVIDRAKQINEMFEQSVSPTQRARITSAMLKNADHLLRTDVGKAMLADRAAIVDPSPMYGKVGRNDLCPCGSGRKYKRCHGG